MVRSLCENESLWTSFLYRLDTAKNNVQEIFYERDTKRVSQDLGNYPYFWVYPEEMLPPVR